jgi:hypothetical protein
MTSGICSNGTLKSKFQAQIIYTRLQSFNYQSGKMTWEKYNPPVVNDIIYYQLWLQSYEKGMTQVATRSNELSRRFAEIL